MFKQQNFWLITIMTLFGVLLFLIPVLNHYYFRTNAFDYGAYNFALYDYSHFRISNNPVYWHEKMTFLQDHLSFTLFFFIPLFWILKGLFGTYLLLLIQTGFIMWGGWATYRLVLEKTTSSRLSIMALLLYFISYGRYSSFVTDVNLMIILSSFVPVFLLYFNREKLFMATACFLFLILGRESVSLWMFFISVLLMIMYRKEKRQLLFAKIYLLASILFFIISFKLVIPLVENPNRPFNLFNYSALGEGPFEALIYMLQHPIKCFFLLFENHSGNPIYNDVKAEFYLVYLISGGALLFLRPKYLIPFFPIVLQKMLNDEPIRWSIETYYAIEFVSLMPLFIAFTLHELKNEKLKSALAYTACAGTLFMCIHKMDFGNRKIKWYGVEKTKFWDIRMYSSAYDVKKIHQQLSLIPVDANVSASENLVPHLSYRNQINYFPKVQQDVEYIALLLNGKHFHYTEEQFQEKINSYLSDPAFEVLINEDSFILLKKNKIEIGALLNPYKK